MFVVQEGEGASEVAAAAVDSIDDNLKERGVSVVKTSSAEQIELYDIEVLPKLVYFEVGGPQEFRMEEFKYFLSKKFDL